MSRNATKRYGRIALVLALALAAAAFLWRVRRTPEWTVLFGKPAARVDICRSVYLKKPWRAEPMLRRLLADPSSDVQVAAIEALQRAPHLDRPLQSSVEPLTASASPLVRGRALRYLVERTGEQKEPWVERAFDALLDRDFRKLHPELVELVVQIRAEQGDAAAVEWALSILTDEDVLVAEALTCLCRYPDLLRPHRPALLDRLARSSGAVRSFLVAALTAVDGRARGYAVEDWAVESETPAVTTRVREDADAFTFEAEWAYTLLPNYQIEPHEGEMCLYLGEGAGGARHWNRGDDGSVNIGAGMFPFAVSKTQNYQVWIRGWYENKCGNAVGLAIDGERIGIWNNSENDAMDRYGVWYWKQANAAVRLTKGRHVLKIKALEDGASVDKLALLPSSDRFNSDAPPETDQLFDDAVPSTLSFRTESYVQMPGTTQTVTVWIRRNRPDITSGKVRLIAGAPFEVAGPEEAEVHFSGEDPLGQQLFSLRVPQEAAGREATLTAEFRVNGRTEAIGTIIMGVPFDWRTTGPLSAEDALCAKLRAKTRLDPEDLRTGWSPYPAKGYDRYRRLDFEMAYGETLGKYVFLHTEIEVAEEGRYVSLMTIDDHGCVWVDGKRVSGRAENGYSEGRLMVETIRLERGRHQVFMRVYQCGYDDLDVYDRQATVPNHWVCLWLLREARLRPASGIRGVRPPEAGGG